MKGDYDGDDDKVVMKVVMEILWCRFTFPVQIRVEKLILHIFSGLMCALAQFFVFFCFPTPTLKTSFISYSITMLRKIGIHVLRI